MTDKMLEEVLKRLDNLAALIGDGAVEVWPLLIRKVYLSAIFNVGVFCVLSTLMYVIIKKIKRLCTEDTSDKTQLALHVYGTLSVFITIFLVVSCLLTIEALFDVCNLELSALSNLSKMLRPGR